VVGSWASVVIENCFFYGNLAATTHGHIHLSQSRGEIIVRRNSISDSTANGIYVEPTASLNQVEISYNAIYRNNKGIWINATQTNTHVSLLNNVIYGNTSHGVDTNAADADGHMLSLENNVIAGNGGYGIALSAAFAAGHIGINRNNNYNANTSGHWQNVPSGASNPPGTDDQTGDPQFTSVTSGSENFKPAAGSPLIDAGSAVPTA
jgi:hypothetical protein